MIAVIARAAGLARKTRVACFARAIWKACSLRALHAELTGIMFPPAQPAPEIPGWPGWTREQLADPRYGINPVTGGPRYDKDAAGLRERRPA